jgi:hypothetical protein
MMENYRGTTDCRVLQAYLSYRLAGWQSSSRMHQEAVGHSCLDSRTMLEEGMKTRMQKSMRPQYMQNLSDILPFSSHSLTMRP